MHKIPPNSKAGVIRTHSLGFLLSDARPGFRLRAAFVFRFRSKSWAHGHVLRFVELFASDGRVKIQARKNAKSQIVRHICQCTTESLTLSPNSVAALTPVSAPSNTPAHAAALSASIAKTHP